MVQVVEYLLGKYKALSSNPGITQKNQLVHFGANNTFYYISIILAFFT
jgi:hypothetical protein